MPMKHVNAEVRRNRKFRVELTPMGYIVVFCLALFAAGFTTGIFWAAN